MIEPYPLKMFPKESKHSKFYFFDCGVVRAAQGHQAIEDVPEQRGFYFETIILNELKTYFEVKFSKTWKSEYEKVLLKTKENFSKQMLKTIDIYLGHQRLTRGPIDVYPIDEFVQNLWKDRLI